MQKPVRQNDFYNAPTSQHVFSGQQSWYFPAHYRPVSTAYNPRQPPLTRYHFAAPSSRIAHSRPPGYMSQDGSEQVEFPQSRQSEEAEILQNIFIGDKQSYFYDLSGLGIQFPVGLLLPNVPAGLLLTIGQCTRYCDGFGKGFWPAILFRYFESLIDGHCDIAQEWMKVKSKGISRTGCRDLSWYNPHAIDEVYRTSRDILAIPIGARVHFALEGIFKDQSRVFDIVRHFKLMLSCFIAHNRRHYGQDPSVILSYSDELRRLRDDGLNAIGLKALADLLETQINVVDVSPVPTKTSIVPSAISVPEIYLLYNMGQYQVLYPNEGASSRPMSSLNSNMASWPHFSHAPVDILLPPPELPNEIETNIGYCHPVVQAVDNPGYLDMPGDILYNSYAFRNELQNAEISHLDYVLDGQPTLTDSLLPPLNNGPQSRQDAADSLGSQIHHLTAVGPTSNPYIPGPTSTVGLPDQGIPALPAAPARTEHLAFISSDFEPADQLRTTSIAQPVATVSRTANPFRRTQVQEDYDRIHTTTVSIPHGGHARSSARTNAAHCGQPTGGFRPLQYLGGSGKEKTQARVAQSKGAAGRPGPESDTTPGD
ncbi:Hypothetical protein D9617_22g066630 [Elsinoe fawcettii]|nr:Hypothetical protein D9617_22g066630 [Elsinoe fawcettii]